MNKELLELKNSLTTLTASQKKTTYKLTKQNEWQDTITKQMAIMLQCHNESVSLGKQKQESDLLQIPKQTGLKPS